MAKTEYKGVLISDFTLDNFAGYLNNDGETPSAEGVVAPFGQVVQILADGGSRYWKAGPDFAVVWTRPEGVSPSFNQALDYNKIKTRNILEEVDEYSSLLLNLRKRTTCAFVPTWTLPPYQRGFGMLDMKQETGLANILMRMNLRLAENLAKEPAFYLLDARKWIETAGRKAFNPELWYMGKVAFGNEVFIEAVKDIKSALRGISGGQKKIIILDLDDTLWGGVVGDVGLENIRLGGHDHIGEAHRDFQSALKALTNRGILLGIVSKNEEATAMEAINKHPEMVLKACDFAGWKINWQDKAQNIIDLMSELKLGLQSAVFIDDNPAERERVRTALPEVFVPEWPDNAMLYKSTLISLRCFDAPSLTPEDRRRARMYVLDRRRRDMRKKAISPDEWLKGLKTVVRPEGLNSASLGRAVQLLNKTNQMNLSTRRMTEVELSDWANGKNRRLWTFRVSDKFGDSGLTGIISVEVNGKTAEIVDFVLSCRVTGRNIEEAMLSVVVNYARSLMLAEVRLRYMRTEKNNPCLMFLEASGFDRDDNGLFVLKLNRGYAVPEHIEIVE